MAATKQLIEDGYQRSHPPLLEFEVFKAKVSKFFDVQPHHHVQLLQVCELKYSVRKSTIFEKMPPKNHD